MNLQGSETEAPQLVENLIGGFGPPKRFPLLVMRGDIGEDGLAQLSHAAVGATFEGSFR